MRETEKTNLIRTKEFFTKYCQGKGIDIGAGDSTFVPNSESFDVKDGDANVIDEYRKPLSYDFVHSSHCLEHMNNPKSALQTWWNLLKPGGYLILVVPDERLYEQGIWPSIFGLGHKWSFYNTGDKPLLEGSIDVCELVSNLEDAQIIEATKQDHNYNYSFLIKDGKTWTRSKMVIRIITSLYKRCIRSQEKYGWIKRTILATIRDLKIPIDQTRANALAQIQIVAKKIKKNL